MPKDFAIFKDVLDAQRSLLSLHMLAISVATVSSELVRLYKALGGGWSGSEMLPVGVTGS